jgi:L-iditol 2-dehydrogenase
VCGSDLPGYTGQSGCRTSPVIMGHEAAGIGAKVGPAVTNVKPSDRVAIRPIKCCGVCAFCEEGKASLCATRLVFGHQMAGGAYAEWLVWPGRNLYPLSDHLSFEQAAFAEPLAYKPGLGAAVPARLQHAVFYSGDANRRHSICNPG